MFCPDCNKEVASTAKSCPNCGLSLVKGKSASANRVIAIGIIVILVLALIAGGGYAILSQLPGEKEPVQSYVPGQLAWFPLKVDPYGINLEVPGTGWHLYYDALSQVIFKDDLRATLDINIIGAMALNPDGERIDNKPQVFRIISQESIFLEGHGEALYTVAQGKEAGVIVNKHQLYFRRTIKTPNLQSQTFTYLITMTCGSGRDSQYAPTFRHIIESIDLYEYY